MKIYLFSKRQRKVNGYLFTKSCTVCMVYIYNFLIPHITHIPFDKKKSKKQCVFSNIMRPSTRHVCSSSTVHLKKNSYRFYPKYSYFPKRNPVFCLYSENNYFIFSFTLWMFVLNTALYLFHRSVKAQGGGLRAIADMSAENISFFCTAPIKERQKGFLLSLICF